MTKSSLADRGPIRTLGLSVTLVHREIRVHHFTPSECAVAAVGGAKGEGYAPGGGALTRGRHFNVDKEISLCIVILMS